MNEEEIASSLQKHGLRIFVEPILKRKVCECYSHANELYNATKHNTNVQIDVDALLRFDETDVAGLGVGTSLHRRRMMRWIRTQQQKRPNVRSDTYYYKILIVLVALLAVLGSVTYSKERVPQQQQPEEQIQEQHENNPFETYRNSASVQNERKWEPSLTKGQVRSRMDRFAEELRGEHTADSLDKLFESIEDVAWKSPTESVCASSMYNLYHSMNTVLKQVESSSETPFPESWILELRLRMYRMLENVVDIFPASLMAWEKMATHIDKYFAANKTMQSRAIEALERVLTMNSKKATAWLQLSKLEMQVGNITAALECLRTLAPLLPKSSIVEDTEDDAMRRKLLMNLDMSLMRNILTAICSGGEEEDDDDHITMGSRGWACEQTNRGERALSFYERALQRSSETSSTPYVNLAQYYMKRNRLDDAEHMFREAVR